MRRSAVALLVFCAAASARAGEGVYLTVDGGYGTWAKDDFRSIRVLKRNASTPGKRIVPGL